MLRSERIFLQAERERFIPEVLSLLCTEGVSVMDTFAYQPGLPPALLAALQTMDDGGMLYTVAQATHPTSAEILLVPCFVVRSPVSASQIATARVEVTTRFVTYEVEGPLTIFHLKIYDRPATHRPVKAHGRLIGVQIEAGNPFELECFLNPTVERDRFMLQALESSPLMTIAFYGTDASMTYQATRQYPLPLEQQQAARQILAATSGLLSRTSRFLSAQQRFMRENPLWEGGSASPKA